MPAVVAWFQHDLVADAGEAGVGAEPAPEDLGEAVAVLAREAGDVDGHLHEVGLVVGPVDFRRGGARGEARILVAVRKEEDRPPVRVGDLAGV